MTRVGRDTNPGGCRWRFPCANLYDIMCEQKPTNVCSLAFVYKQNIAVFVQMVFYTKRYQVSLSCVSCAANADRFLQNLNALEKNLQAFAALLCVGAKPCSVCSVGFLLQTLIGFAELRFLRSKR